MNEAISSERAEESAKETSVQRILVPTDLSPIADLALETALSIARVSSARIEVLTVVGQLEGDPYSPVKYSPEASVRGSSPRQMMHEGVSDLVDRHDTSGVRVAVSVHRGSPVKQILAAARTTLSDLVVIGTHHRSPLQHFLVKSTAEEIVRRSNASVLIIHERDDRREPAFKRIVTAVDLSSASSEVVGYGAAVAGWFEAGLTVVHVVEDVPLLDSFAGAMTMRDVVPGARRNAADELAVLLEQVAVPAERRQVLVRTGHAAAEIIELAEDEGADLIVVGKRGRSAVERFFIGSVTERVVRYAPCPVLVVHTTPARRKTDGRSST